MAIRNARSSGWLPVSARYSTGSWLGSTFSTEGESASCGSVERMALTRRSTSLAARSTLPASVKVIVTCERPSLEKDWMLSMFAMPATASSMGFVISRSTSSGAAPEYVVSTVTTGVLMFG